MKQFLLGLLVIAIVSIPFTAFMFWLSARFNRPKSLNQSNTATNIGNWKEPRRG